MDVARGKEEVEECGNTDDQGQAEVLLETGRKDLAFDIADLSKTYGPGQRGATAARSFAAGDLIQSEVATVYVAAPMPRDDENQGTLGYGNYNL
jgi:hypothetical protein